MTLEELYNKLDYMVRYENVNPMFSTNIDDIRIVCDDKGTKSVLLESDKLVSEDADLITDSITDCIATLNALLTELNHK